MARFIVSLIHLLVFAPTIVACGGALTREEAKESLEEIEVASQSQALTSNSIELTTHFTIGDAVEAAADELRTFVQSQLPCAEITVEASSASVMLRVEYGKNPGSCLYRGQNFEGTHEIVLSRNDMDRVLVDHTWTDFTNGLVMVNGTANVEWDLEDPSRHVVHEAEWTRLKDGRTGTGTGDRIQRPLSGGILEGFSVDGERHWKGQKGDWNLIIDDVEMRWVDAVPRAGSYTLDTPFDKQVSLSFERKNATSIHVTVSGPKKSFGFDVVTLPSGTPASSANDAG